MKQIKLRIYKIYRWFTKTRRRKILSSILAILIVLTSIRFIFIKTPEVKAAWWDDSYGYRHIVSFTHNADISDDRAVTFTLDTLELISAGLMQSDCDDTRYTDINGKELYFDLTGTCNNASTTYEVIFPSIINGTNTFYVYYGNPSASNTEVDSTLYTALTPSGGDPSLTNPTTSGNQEKGPAPAIYLKFDEGVDNTCPGGTNDACDSTSNGNDGAASGGGGPTNIDDASDFGEMPGAARQVVRISTGTLYATLNDGGNCEMWKSSNGSSWTFEDAVTCDSSSHIAVAIDSGDTIHTLYSTASLAHTYASFSTSTDTFGTPESLFTEVDNVVSGSISIDSSDIPHVVLSGDEFDVSEYISDVKYTNRIGGSWKSVVNIENGTSAGGGLFSRTDITISEDDIAEISYFRDVDHDLTAALGNLNNATSFSLFDVDTDIPDSPQTSTSIGIDSSGNTWIAYADEDGASDFVTLVEHLDASDWTTWQTPVDNGNVGSRSKLAIDGSDIYVFYQEDSTDQKIAYDKYDGSSWLGETTLQTPGGAFDLRDAEPLWSFNNNPSYTTYGIDYLYSNGTDIFWANLSISTAWQTEDMCISGKCLIFNGTGNVVAVTNANSIDFDLGLNDAFTFQAWVRVNSDGENDTGEIFDKGSHFYMRVDSEGADELADLEVFVDLATTDPTVNIVNGITLDRWHHVAAAYTDDADDDISVYIDGILAGTGDGSGAPAGTDTSNLLIGGDSSNNFHGFIDEVKVYDEERTAAQIKTDFQKISALHGASASFGDDKSFLSDGLSGYWKLDESSGNASDSSGNENSLTNNATTTFVGGKFSNGSEHVPASSQYLSSTSTNTYYFDNSDSCTGLCQDPDSVWSTDSFAFDGDNSNTASTSTEGDTTSDYLRGDGTNAPSTGETITNVQARIRGNTDGTAQVVAAAIYSDGLGSLLGTATVTSTSLTWGSYVTLSAPGGSWDWTEVQSLETKIYYFDTGNTAYAARVEVLVESGPTINNARSVSFWTNPDSNTNYYISLTSSAYITSSSGIISATGFTNPKIYVNGTATAAISANSWQLVTVTTDTEIDANQFYVGRQGSNYFDGTMDEVRLYNRSFSPNDVAKLYTFGPGPVGYWNFDENTGTTTAYDRSSNGNNLTLTSMTELSWVPGKFGSALTFDGSADSATRADDADFDFTASANFTVEAWIKHNGTITGSSDYILTKADTTNGGYKLYMDDSGDACFVIDDDTSWDTDDSACTSGVDYDDDNWHHFVGVKTGTTQIELFVDGVSAASDASIVDTNTLENTNALYVGADRDGTSDEWDGEIDEVKIYNYARTSEQIIEDMNAGHPAPGSPIGSAVAHWKFDEGYGNISYDSSPNGNNGDLGGSGQTCPASGTVPCPTWQNEGKFGKTLNFDGGGGEDKDDYVQVSPDSSINNFFDDGGTLSLWLNMESDGESGAGRAFAKSANALFGNSNSGNVSKLRFTSDFDDTNGSWIMSDYEVTWGEWTHVVVTYNNSSTSNIPTIYVNGVAVEIDTTTTPIGTRDDDSSSSMFIGNISSGARAYDGNIDEVQVYTSALSENQIKILYNQGSAAVWGATSTDSSGNASWSATDEYCPPGQGSACTAPAGEWKFDENTGSSAYDTSENNNTGPLDTGVTWIPGKFGSAVKFYTGGDEINYGTISDMDMGTSDFTISGWVKMSSSSTVNYPTLVQKGATAPDVAGYWYFWHDSNNFIRLSINDDSVETRVSCNGAAGNLNDNSWHFLTATVDRTNDVVDLYLDGVLDNEEGTSCDISKFTGNITEATKDFRVVHGSNNSGDFLVDNLRVYKYLRTRAQISWEYNQGAPVGWWKFDECQGTTAYDSSGNGNNGTITPGASTHTSVGACDSGSASEMWDDGETGKRNYSLDFDGGDDYVDMNDVASLDFNDADFSIAGWFNRETYTTDDTIVAKRNGITTSDQGYIVYIDDATDKLTFEACDAASGCDEYQIESTSTFTSTGWNHFVVVWDDDSVANTTIYINGIKENASRTGTLANVADLTNSVDFRIGGESDTAGATPFAGELDDIRVFNYTLTQQQIRDVYNSGAIFYGPDTGSP